MVEACFHAYMAFRAFSHSVGCSWCIIGNRRIKGPLGLKPIWWFLVLFGVSESAEVQVDGLSTLRRHSEGSKSET